MKLPQVVVLAGGLGTRLGDLTSNRPKSLVPILGRPFIEWQIELLREKGFTSILFCIGHHSNEILKFLDSKSYDIEVLVVNDGEQLRGTGGALISALPHLGSEFFVMYGDSYLMVPPNDIYQSFRLHSSKALMTISPAKSADESANVYFEDGKIRLYEKNSKNPKLNYLDYGYSIFRNESLSEYRNIPNFDLSKIHSDFIEQGSLEAYVVKEKYFEIGSHQGICELEKFLKGENK